MPGAADKAGNAAAQRRAAKTARAIFRFPMDIEGLPSGNARDSLRRKNPDAKKVVSSPASRSKATAREWGAIRQADSLPLTMRSLSSGRALRGPGGIVRPG